MVVDDASPQRAVSAAASSFAQVRVLRLETRRGFCAAVNAGIQEARGPIVELLNDDTEVTAGWAEAALANFRAPSVAAVAPLVLYWPGASEQGVAIVDSAGDRYYVGGVAGKRGHRQPLRPAILRRCRVFGASGSSAFYRREALLRVGAFPESFGAYFEDVDLAFRLHRAGYEIVFEPASRVLHHVSASYGRARRELLEQQSQNEERVFWRNLPPRLLARALPRHLAVLTGKAWRRWQEGTLVPFLCGRFRVLGEVKELVRHRRWLARLGPAKEIAGWEIDRSAAEL
jgi:GT2 family glycosyltransferase